MRFVIGWLTLGAGLPPWIDEVRTVRRRTGSSYLTLRPWRALPGAQVGLEPLLVEELGSGDPTAELCD